MVYVVTIWGDTREHAPTLAREGDHMTDTKDWHRLGAQVDTISRYRETVPLLNEDGLRAMLEAKFWSELDRLPTPERYMAVDALLSGYLSVDRGRSKVASTDTLLHHVELDDFYAGIDAGIRFAVRVLHAAGIETCQSCEGGQGHSYKEPSIDLRADGPHRASGFRALSALADYGLHVRRVELVWDVVDDLPTERIWRIVLRKAHPERADERPQFIHGCVPNVGRHGAPLGDS